MKCYDREFAADFSGRECLGKERNVSLYRGVKKDKESYVILSRDETVVCFFLYLFDKNCDL